MDILSQLTPEQLEECRDILRKLNQQGVQYTLEFVARQKGYLSADSPKLALNMPGYEILEKLGEGGMGSVYKARHIAMDRVYAVKALSPQLAQNPKARERFVREGQAMARLSHPNIVNCVNAGEAGGVPYIVMEFLDGLSLRGLLQKRGRLPESEAGKIILQLARALDHAHQNGVLHRDVKPGNVMILSDGTVKLTDFGLAWREDNPGLTTPGMVVGTPNYLSPEIARGERDLDARSDVYSLGILFWELLAGKLPFTGASSAETLAARITADVPPAPATPAVRALVARMTARDRKRRTPDCAALISELEAALAPRPVSARAAAPGPAVKKTNFVLIALSAGGAAAVLVAVLFFALPRGGTPAASAPSDPKPPTPKPAAPVQADPARLAFEEFDTATQKMPTRARLPLARRFSGDPSLAGTPWQAKAQDLVARLEDLFQRERQARLQATVNDISRRIQESMNYGWALKQLDEIERDSRDEGGFAPAEEEWRRMVEDQRGRLRDEAREAAAAIEREAEALAAKGDLSGARLKLLEIRRLGIAGLEAAAKIEDLERRIADRDRRTAQARSLEASGDLEGALSIWTSLGEAKDVTRVEGMISAKKNPAPPAPPAPPKPVEAWAATLDEYFEKAEAELKDRRYAPVLEQAGLLRPKLKDPEKKLLDEHVLSARTASDLLSAALDTLISLKGQGLTLEVRGQSETRTATLTGLSGQEYQFDLTIGGGTMRRSLSVDKLGTNMILSLFDRSTQSKAMSESKRLLAKGLFQFFDGVHKTAGKTLERAKKLGEPVAQSILDEIDHKTGVAARPAQRSKGQLPGLAGRYYENKPEAKTPLLVRVDETIEFNWKDGSPDKSVPRDNFRVVWTGYVSVPVAAKYVFSTRSDDGVRLTIGDKLIIDNWTNHGPKIDRSEPIELKPGRHPLKLEYYEAGGGAVMELFWNLDLESGLLIPIDKSKIIPAESLWHDAADK